MDKKNDSSMKQKYAHDVTPQKISKNNHSQEEPVKVKKPFDKKSYRLKKYSKKYKLEQWEEQRKKKLLRNYYNDTKNDPSTGSYKPISFDDQDTRVGRFVRHPDLIEENLKAVKKDPFWKAKEHFNKLKQEKSDQKNNAQRVREEKMKKFEEYKEKKAKRFKKLSRKTKKGQPVMTGRLELLLEKIQKKE